MANVKNLLKKSTNLGANALLLVSTLLPTLSVFSAQTVHATTQAPSTGGQALQPTVYDNYDTGAHNWSDSSLTNVVRDSSKWSALGTTQISGNWFNLTQNKKNQAGYGIFNASMDMSQTTSISGMFRTQIINPAAGNDFNLAGDAVGFILTPTNKAQINANSSKPSSNNRPVNFPTGAGLGIGGLPGSVFVGRDLYYNASSGLADDPTQDIDGANQWFGQSPSPIYATVIRTTYDSKNNQILATPGTLYDQGAGNLIPDPVGTYNNGSKYPIDKWGGKSYYSAGSAAEILQGTLGKQTEDERVTMTWTPDSAGATTATISGTLTYVAQACNSDGSINTGAGSATVSQKLVLPRSMSIGVVGGTGSNYGNISFSNNTSNITGYRGTTNAQVNYINATTGKKIATYPTSTITANVGDRLAIGAASSVAGLPGKYTYSAPAVPTGYTAQSKVTFGGSFDANGVLSEDVDSTKDPNDSTNSTGGLTMINYDAEGANNPNEINIYYTPKSITSHIYQALSAGSPGSYTLTDSQLKTLGGADFSGFASSTGSIGWAGVNPGLGTQVSGTDTSGLNSSVPINVSGITDGAYTYPSLTTLTGYVIDKIYYQNVDNTWASYSGQAGWTQLQSDHPNMNGGTNAILVTYAKMESGTVHFLYNPEISPGVDDSGLPSDNPEIAGKRPPDLPSDYAMSGQFGAHYPFEASNINNALTPGYYTYQVYYSAEGLNSDTPGDVSAQAKLDIFATQSGVSDWAHMSFIDSSNDINVMISPISQKINVKYVVDDDPNATVPDQSTLSTQKTNATISPSLITKSDTAVNTALAGSSYIVGSVTAPDGTVYSASPDGSASAMVNAMNGTKYVLPGGENVASYDGANDYTVHLVDAGTLELSAPDTIDFGTHPISGATQNLTGNLDQAVEVTDTRSSANLSPWTLSVAETSPLQDVSGKISQTFSGLMSFNNSTLTDQPLVVQTHSNPSTGEVTTVVSKNSSAFQLQAPESLQRQADYQGQLTWTLTTAP